VQELKQFLPQNSYEKVIKYFDDSFTLKIVNPRKTKLGDFRPNSSRNLPSKITINNNLNQYSFLITLIHEISHHTVWKKYRSKVAPHGKEWKSEFKYLMLPFLHPSILPEDVIKAISKYLINPKAASCSDVNLYRTLSSYDDIDDDTIMLELIPNNTLFSISNDRIFRKGIKRRTRYLCTEIRTKKQYTVRGTAFVKIVDK
jgi:hypothetical protein